MTIENINYGQAPDDGTGDKLRDAFKKVDDNFKQLELNKANSTDVITALEAKVDKVQGKGLSTEDFTTANKQQLDNLPAQLAGIGTQFSDVSIALGTKVDKVAGKSLSTNDFTDELKQKLAGLESSHFKGLFASLAALQAAIPVAVAGDYADVDLGTGQEVSRYLWDVSDSSWVQQAAPAPQLTAAQVKTLYESNPDTNAFTDSQELKLQSIEAGAQKNVPTNLDKDTTATQITVTSSTGQSVILPAATQASAGLLSAADKKKIDDIGAIGGELFDFMWHNGPRSSMDAGRIATDGQQISYLMYPQVCQAIWDGKQNAVTESVWQSDDSKINCWSTGDGNSWVRVPDLNAATGRGKPFYLRGGSAALNGTSVGDAIRNITASTTDALETWGSIRDTAAVSGAFKKGRALPNFSGNGFAGAASHALDFDASLVVPTADENRVKTAYGVWTVRVATVVSNSSAIDAAQLATQITTLDAKVQNLPTGGFKNKIINGKMEIAQRGTSFAAIASGAYSLDRWFIPESTEAVVNVSQSSDVPSGSWFRASLRYEVATADTSIGATQSSGVSQHIEGYNVSDLIGRTFTLSFWVRSSKTGVHCVSFRNSGLDRSYIAEYTVNKENTWEYKTITVSGGLITAGTWNWTNNVGVAVRWEVAAGANLQTTPNTWQTGNFVATANQVNCLDTVGNIFAITGVQLEVGEDATGFDHRPYGAELALCQRYYEAGRYNILGSASSANFWFVVMVYYRVTKRANPTVTITAPYVASASKPTVVNFGTNALQVRTQSTAVAGVVEVEGTYESSAEL